jgi:hypothetical protein
MTQETDDVFGFVRRNVRGVSRANADGAIDGQHGDDGEIILGLHEITLVLNVFQEAVILFAKDVSHNVLHICVNVTRRSGVFSSEKT